MSHHPSCPVRHGASHLCVCGPRPADFWEPVDRHAAADHATLDGLLACRLQHREFLTAAPTPGRGPVSPPPGPHKNAGRWDRLAGRGEDWSMLLAVAALSFLVAGLLIGWWTP